MNSQRKLFLYSDDKALIISSTTCEASVQNTKSNMCNTNKWFLKYNLRLHFSKTKFIAFSKILKELSKLNVLKIHNLNCNSNNDLRDVINKTGNIEILELLLINT